MIWQKILAKQDEWTFELLIQFTSELYCGTKFAMLTVVSNEVDHVFGFGTKKITGTPKIAVFWPYTVRHSELSGR